MAAENFEPEIKFYELEYFLRKNEEINLRNDSLYKRTKKLTNLAYPTYRNEFDKGREYFFLPAKRSGKLISIPFGVMEYQRRFYLNFHGLGHLCIAKGKKKTESFYRKILDEAIRFSGVIRKDVKIVRKTVPYDIRTGRIKGKYVMNEILSQNEKAEITKDYTIHLKENLKAKDCSLNEYLHVASICYKSAFGRKETDLKPVEKYKKWADSRDAGMLSIKNKNSRKEFAKWLKSGGHTGGHPFEIVFSWIDHGIHLYPPASYNSWRYGLRVTNYAYAEVFVKMLKALIRENVPFTAHDLEKVLEYLTGESYFTVNEYSDNLFFYCPSKEDKKQYFKHIEWDELKIVRFK